MTPEEHKSELKTYFAERGGLTMTTKDLKWSELINLYNKIHGTSLTLGCGGCRNQAHNWLTKN